jgi:glyoxylase-like metal-dependent hydrolase (beta-lactamase superfamily II)
VSTDRVGEILDQFWRFESSHPEWTEDEGGEDGWEPLVAWWAVRVPAGLVLIDPLPEDWSALDQLVKDQGGCAGIVRTCHWHQRSIAEASARYGAEVWAGPSHGDHPVPAFDHELADQQELFDRIVVFDMARIDELALWLPTQRALIFGDAMLRRADGELRICPDSWTQPEGGAAWLRQRLRGLTTLPVEHVLVSHGPLSLGDGLESLRAATN